MAKKKKDDVFPFVLLLWQLLNDEANALAIRWNDAGTAVHVSDWAALKPILPKYFKHNKGKSFVRQLNIYGFKKVVGKKDEWRHPNFARDGVGELHKVIRSEPDADANADAEFDLRKMVAKLSEKVEAQSAQIAALGHRVAELEQQHGTKRKRDDDASLDPPAKRVAFDWSFNEALPYLFDASLFDYKK